MPKIHVLTPHIANQIAAGEVVERPSSVVKELVENAIDAGADAITIEIENGGTDCIRVLDNGSGIADEDCETAFLRHATSKIASAADLSSIRSLGFRGEALASIAAVSRVSLQTRTDEDELGTLIRYEGGELIEHRRTGGTRGTSVEVRDLFYNVPARLKFLKSARAESAAIGDYVARLILSEPGVAVHFINNGKTVYRSAGGGELRDALITVYGVGVGRQVFPILFDDGYIRITGFVGAPDLSRPNRTGQTITLNGRIIRSNALSNALSRAFDTRVMTGRFPFALVCLQLSFAEADVNVHPAKLEVRFADEPRVTRSLVAACSESLIKSYVPTVESAPPEAGGEDALSSERERFHVELRTRPTDPSRTLRETDRANTRIPDVPFFRLSRPETPSGPEAQTNAAPPEAAPFAAPYAVVGCAFDAYWFVQQGECVYCVDQHAAHERLLYDALMERRAAVVSQTLFLPEEVRLLPTEADTFAENRKELESFGFVFSDADETSVTLLAVPQVNGTALRGDFLHDLLHRLSDAEEEINRNDWFRNATAQTACKHAVKAGERINAEELDCLLRRIAENDTLLTCPHGRPVAFRWTKTEIEKLFKRIP